MTPEQYSAAWTRRPANAVGRLGGRQLLLLSARDLLKATAAERGLLVALVAPAPAAMLGFARAARDANAPLVLLRPCGSLGEKGPEEARDDLAFVEAALRAAEEVSFGGPIALLKDAPARPSPNEAERVHHEIETGFTGLALRVRPGAVASGQAEAAKEIGARELGLEVVPDGGSGGDAVATLATLRNKGGRPTAVRLTGQEQQIGALAEQLGTTVASSAAEPDPALREQGVRELIASAPFLRALRRAAPAELWDRMAGFARDNDVPLEAAAARHQRHLRDLPQETQDKLEALASFEAAELFERVGAQGSAARLLSRIGEMQA